MRVLSQESLELCIGILKYALEEVKEMKKDKDKVEDFQHFLDNNFHSNKNALEVMNGTIKDYKDSIKNLTEYYIDKECEMNFSDIKDDISAICSIINSHEYRNDFTSKFSWNAIAVFTKELAAVIE